jgi:hypothetical protein
VWLIVTLWVSQAEGWAAMERCRSFVLALLTHEEDPAGAPAPPHGLLHVWDRNFVHAMVVPGCLSVESI